MTQNRFELAPAPADNGGTGWRWELPDLRWIGGPSIVSLGALTIVVDAARPDTAVQIVFDPDGDASESLSLEGREQALLTLSSGSQSLELPNPAALGPLSLVFEQFQLLSPDSPSWSAGELLVLLRHFGLDLTDTAVEADLVTAARLGTDLIPPTTRAQLESSPIAERFGSVQRAIEASTVSAASLAEEAARYLATVSASLRPRLQFATSGAGTSTQLFHGSEAALIRVDLDVDHRYVSDVHTAATSDRVQVDIVGDPVAGAPTDLVAQIISPGATGTEPGDSRPLTFSDGGLSASLRTPAGDTADWWIRVTTESRSDRPPKWFVPMIESNRWMRSALDRIRRANAYGALDANSLDAIRTEEQLRLGAERAARLAATSSDEPERIEIAWEVATDASASATGQPTLRDLIDAAVDTTDTATVVREAGPATGALLGLAELSTSAEKAAACIAATLNSDPDSAVLLSVGSHALARLVTTGATRSSNVEGILRDHLKKGRPV